MSEFLSSFSKWFQDKANSPLYWTYFGFFVAWNWKFFQVVFLEDASLFSSPRIEYLNSLNITLLGNNFLNWVVNMLWRIVPPIGFTYAAIIWLPALHKWAFGIYLTHYFDRKTLFQERKAEYEEKMAKLVKQEAVAKKERAEQERVIEKTKTEEEKWREEFEKIKDKEPLKGFGELVVRIYGEGGVLRTDQVEGVVSSSVVAFAGVYDLTRVIDRKYGSGTLSFIELTDKGKYFSRLLSEKEFAT